MLQVPELWQFDGLLVGQPLEITHSGRDPVRSRVMIRPNAAVPLRLLVVLMLPLVAVGCPKKAPPPVEDSAPPPPASTPSVTELAPLTDTADASDAAPEAAPKKWTGPSLNPNQMKIEACCNAMRAQAKAMGANSPESFQINAAAAQCDVFAKQIGPQGNAPEFAQLRGILKSLKLPAVCQF